MPDGKLLEAVDGATVADVAAMIGPGLARVAIGGRVSCNGHVELVDVHRALPGDCELTVLTTKDDNADSLYLLRHSCAHVMAEAICSLYPDAKLVYGPPLDDGFYYDIDLGTSITVDDFERIESGMSRIIKQDRRFCRYEMTRDEAMPKLRAEGNRYKIDNAERAEGDSLSFYVTGERRGTDFEDLCRGPHIPSTGVIKAFKIRQVSGSHYRGDVNDQPLQRVYGTAFFKKSSLKDYLTRMEEAKKRDHRVIGKKLELFSIRESVGSGLILWMPKGAVIRTELQTYLTGEMIKLGYDIVYTPHIAQLDLFRTSGHYPYYEESNFPAMFESGRGNALQAALHLAKEGNLAKDGHLAEERHLAKAGDIAGKSVDQGRSDQLNSFLVSIQGAWGPIAGLEDAAPLDSVIEALYAALATETGFMLKPMNCPFHMQIFASKPRSYRDLPVRLAEYGTVYRFEQSGEISGLTRVRGFTQDDAHLFCTNEQLAAELGATVQLTRTVLELLGLTDYRVRLGLRDPDSDKFIGSAENWDKSQAAIREAAVDSGVDFTEEIGEAAFYGPKIDFIVKDCIGRSWQLGTVQVDYNSPERFDLSYVGADNARHVPVMIHRAPFGSMERFVGILIEHFAGAFPLWLSPVQVGVATVSEKTRAYGHDVHRALRDAGIRAELDDGDEKIGPKKHKFREAQVNYILVVGEKESQDGAVNVNDRNGLTVGDMSIDAFVARCRQEIESKGSSPVAPGDCK